MIVLGISGALNHDAAVSVIKDGEILFASHSERYSKIKNDPLLNDEIIQEALSYGKPDVIAWYERPILKKFRQFFAGQFELAFDLDELPVNYLKKFPELDDIKIKYQTHHYTHAASGYFTSGFDEAAVIVIDSIGENETLTMWHGHENKLTKMYTQGYPNSVGLFYSAMTQRLGLKPQEDEYILMGMAAYGDLHRRVDGKSLVKHIYDQFKITLQHSNLENHLIVQIGKNLHRGCKWYREGYNKWTDKLNIAAATQSIYEDIFIGIVEHCFNKYKSKNLVVMGGCA